MTPLEKIVRARIGAEGPLPLVDYMALCLSHPQHGYYNSRPAIGAEGDFTTAPEISQMFGEIVGAWLAHAWELAGRPAAVRLVELGAGRGALMADILRVFRLLPELDAAAEVHLVETSRQMRCLQAAALESTVKAAHWHDRLADVPPGAMLLIANEFFDALPIRQLVRRANAWRERCVGIDNGRLSFVDGPAVAPADVPAPLQYAAEGAIFETSPAGRAIAAEMGTRLADAPGAALIIDYGYRGPAAGDSLQALKTKRPADPLDTPGEADLTAHVDFSGLANAACGAGAAAHGPLTQGTFLTTLGIGLRAERLRAAGGRANDLGLAIERLTGASGMGSLFKVLALTSPSIPVPPPFDSPRP